MINRKAIEEYLDRSWEDHNWIKSLTDLELDEEIKKIPYRLTTPLKRGQKACFLLGIAYNNLNFWVDMGGGKTLLILELMKFYLRTNQIQTGLIYCPTNEIALGWEKEILDWKLGLPYTLLLGSDNEKWNKFECFNRGLLIGTFPSIAWMLSTKQLKHRKNKPDKVELTPDKKLLDLFCRNINAFVIDQTTEVGSRDSLWFKIGDYVSKRADFRYGLAGRAFGRDPITLWPQFYLIDRGETLSSTLGFFREVFYTTKKGYFGGFDYKFKASMENDLSKILNHRSIRYTLEECGIRVDKPTRIVREVSFPEDTNVYYQRIVQEVIAAQGNYQIIQNSFVRLRQVSSGFLGFKDDETGEKAQVEFEDNPKFDLLFNLIQDMPLDRKFLIFYEFTYSGSKICQQLHKLKIKHGWLWSGTKNWQRMYSEFNDNPDFKGLVIQTRKGSMGLNLQAANYVFVYESPVSPIIREEMERRAVRQGQTKVVMIYDLITKDSMDEKILRYHKEGNDLFKDLVDNPRKFLQ